MIRPEPVPIVKYLEPMHAQHKTSYLKLIKINEKKNLYAH